MMNDFPGRQYEVFGEHLLEKRKSDLSFIWKWLFNTVVLPFLVLILIAACLILIGAMETIHGNTGSSLEGSWMLT